MYTRRDAIRLLATGGLGIAAGDALLLDAQTPESSELLIRRGRVVNADGSRETDLRITGDRRRMR
jgi:hypothetical protein